MTDDRSTMEYVDGCMQNEGFFYCFDSYSEFTEVKDEEFHRLRKAFLDAGEALRKYVKAGNK